MKPIEKEKKIKLERSFIENKPQIQSPKLIQSPNIAFLESSIGISKLPLNSTTIS
jgi:hypothetical protein